jgi:SAM-dependent methyltransferase
VLTLETFQRLLSPLGREVLRAAEAYVEPLEAVTALRKTFPPDLVAAAIEMVDLRRRAVTKAKNAAFMFFTREALEQASVGRIAMYRAQRYARYGTVSDWGCGIGIDTLGLSRVARVVAIDSDPLRVAMAEANAQVLERAENIEFVVGDYLVEPIRTEAIWADPSRRPDGRRVTNPALYDPPLSEIVEYAAGRPLGVKVSPAIEAGQIPPEAEAEFISMDGELKEAVLWYGELRTATRRATILPEGETLVPQGVMIQSTEPGKVLYDPDPAVVRAGAVADLGHRLGAWQIDPRIAYLSSDTPVRTPFAQTLMVEAALPWNLKTLKATLRSMGLYAEEVRRRGSAVDVEVVRKALRGTGKKPAIVALTRVMDAPYAIVCTRY